MSSSPESGGAEGTLAELGMQCGDTVWTCQPGDPDSPIIHRHPPSFINSPILSISSTQCKMTAPQKKHIVRQLAAQAWIGNSQIPRFGRAVLGVGTKCQLHRNDVDRCNMSWLWSALMRGKLVAPMHHRPPILTHHWSRANPRWNSGSGCRAAIWRLCLQGLTGNREPLAISVSFLPCSLTWAMLGEGESEMAWSLTPAFRWTLPIRTPPLQALRQRVTKKGQSCSSSPALTSLSQSAVTSRYNFSHDLSIIIFLSVVGSVAFFLSRVDFPATRWVEIPLSSFRFTRTRFRDVGVFYELLYVFPSPSQAPVGHFLLKPVR